MDQSLGAEGPLKHWLAGQEYYALGEMPLEFPKNAGVGQ